MHDASCLREPAGFRLQRLSRKLARRARRLRRTLILSCATFGRAFNAGGRSTVRGGARSAVSMSTLADFKATKIDGSSVDLSSFTGKPTLVLNVASL